MGCSDSNNIYWKAYKLMQIIDSDLKLSSYNNEFYLISTKSIPNFIELIEISAILENITYHDLYFLDGYEEKLKDLFKKYKLEKDIKIYNDFTECKDLAGGNDEQLNEFIIVKKGFLRIMNFEEDRELEKFVMIKWDDNRARNEIYFPNEELSLFFEKKRLGIYKFIIPNEIDEEGNPTDIQIIDINNSTNKNENNTKYNGYSKSRNKTKKEQITTNTIITNPQDFKNNQMFKLTENIPTEFNKNKDIYCENMNHNFNNGYNNINNFNINNNMNMNNNISNYNINKINMNNNINNNMDNFNINNNINNNMDNFNINDNMNFNLNMQMNFSNNRQNQLNLNINNKMNSSGQYLNDLELMNRLLMNNGQNNNNFHNNQYNNNINNNNFNNNIMIHTNQQFYHNEITNPSNFGY